MREAVICDFRLYTGIQQFSFTAILEQEMVNLAHYVA